MNGPRFFPSGKRLGPYFCRRFAASAASRPFPVSVIRRFAASSTDIACQATSSAVVAFAAALMLVLRSFGKDRALTLPWSKAWRAPYRRRSRADGNAFRKSRPWGHLVFDARAEDGRRRDRIAVPSRARGDLHLLRIGQHH